MAALFGIASQQVLPLPDDGAGKDLLTLLFLVGVIALMFVPGVLYRPSGPSPGPPGSSDDGGGGPEPPDPPPSYPPGGVPLLDADQARARTRGHDSPKLHDPKPRRPAHEPRRTPVATKG
jgi:hypothetical protein